MRLIYLISSFAFFALGSARGVDTSLPMPAGPKWHAGHYVLFWESPSDELLEKTVFASPYLTGAQIVYRWDELEPEKGRYDFSAIERDLARSPPRRVPSTPRCLQPWPDRRPQQSKQSRALVQTTHSL